MDLLQDQYDREKINSTKLKDRLAQAAQVVRVAEGLLDAKRSAEHRNGESTGSLSANSPVGEQKAS